MRVGQGDPSEDIDEFSHYQSICLSRQSDTTVIFICKKSTTYLVLDNLIQKPSKKPRGVKEWCPGSGRSELNADARETGKALQIRRQCMRFYGPRECFEKECTVYLQNFVGTKESTKTDPTWITPKASRKIYDSTILIVVPSTSLSSARSPRALGMRSDRAGAPSTLAIVVVFLRADNQRFKPSS